MQMLMPATIRPGLLPPATPRREDLPGPDYSAKRAAFLWQRFGIPQMSSFSPFAEAALVGPAAIIRALGAREQQHPKQRLARAVNPGFPGKSATTIRNWTHLLQLQESE